MKIEDILNHSKLEDSRQMVEDINNDMILTQESWLEDIIVNSYEITRSFEEQYEFDK